MANFIANADLGPEYLESNLKSLLSPAVNFRATLMSGDATTVTIVDGSGTVYGTFVLDTANQIVASGLITGLPNRLKFNVTSGTGRFRITMDAGV